MSEILDEAIIGNCRLILGDSLKVLPELDYEFDAMFADPQYGVELGEVQSGQAQRKEQQAYNSTPDTAEYVRDVCVPIVNLAREKARASMVTSGNRNMFLYDQPDDLGVWFNPAGTSTGKWGFNCVGTPILYYGKDPYAGKARYPSSPTNVGATRDKIKGHPCVKPLSFMKWAVNRIALEGAIVLDPFMGAGTTLVACAHLGRYGVGIEIDREYFELAKRRVQTAYEQQDLFFSQPLTETCGQLFEDANG